MDTFAIGQEIRKVKRRRIEIERLKNILDLEKWNLEDRQSTLERLLHGESRTRNSALATAIAQARRPEDDTRHDIDGTRAANLPWGDTNASSRGTNRAVSSCRAAASLAFRESIHLSPHQINTRPNIGVWDQTMIKKDVEELPHIHQQAPTGEFGTENTSKQNDSRNNDGDDDDVIITGSKRKLSRCQDPIKEEDQMLLNTDGRRQPGPTWKAGFGQSPSSSSPSRSLKSSSGSAMFLPVPKSRDNTTDKDAQQSEYVTLRVRWHPSPSNSQNVLEQQSSQSDDATTSTTGSTVAQRPKLLPTSPSMPSSASIQPSQPLGSDSQSIGTLLSTAHDEAARGRHLLNAIQRNNVPYNSLSPGLSNLQQQQRGYTGQQTVNSGSGLTTAQQKLNRGEGIRSEVDLTSPSPSLSPSLSPSSSPSPPPRPLQVTRAQFHQPSLSMHQTSYISSNQSMLPFSPFSHHQVNRQVPAQLAKLSASERIHLELRFCQRILYASSGVGKSLTSAAPFIPDWQPQLQSIVLNRWRRCLSNDVVVQPLPGSRYPSSHYVLILIRSRRPQQQQQQQQQLQQSSQQSPFHQQREHEQRPSLVHVQGVEQFAELIHALIHEITQDHPRSCCMLPPPPPPQPTRPTQQPRSPSSSSGSYFREQQQQQYSSVCWQGPLRTWFDLQIRRCRECIRTCELVSGSFDVKKKMVDEWMIN